MAFDERGKGLWYKEPITKELLDNDKPRKDEFEKWAGQRIVCHSSTDDSFDKSRRKPDKHRCSFSWLGACMFLERVVGERGLWCRFSVFGLFCWAHLKKPVVALKNMCIYIFRNICVWYVIRVGVS